MKKFAFLLKTYEKDIPYAIRLLKSFALYNVEHLPCFIVLPEYDIKSLKECLRIEELEDIIFINEADCPYLVKESINGISAGYINQEIIKLWFWETKLAENYCCIDSDGEFIRAFFKKDFMYDEETPYTVLFEDGDLKADNVYYNSFWKEREKSLKKIQDVLDFHPYKMLTCHGFQIFSSKVLSNMKKLYMDVNGLSYSDLLEISPYEFSWYNFFLQKYCIIDLHVCGELFKCFHIKNHLLEAWALGIKKKDLARSYVGIVINSNFTHGKLIDLDNIWNSCLGCFEYILKIIKQILKRILSPILK